MRHWAEETARAYLEERGYHLVAANWVARGGELDLVMRRGELLVFIEVRQRRSDRFGTPAETLDPRKLARLRRTATEYLLRHHRTTDLPVRFDAVLVSGTRERFEVEHLEGITV